MVECKKISDREFIVGENRFYLGEDNILYVTTVGEIDGKTALAMREVDSKLKDMVNKKVHVLVDVNKARKPSVKAKEVLSEMIKDNRTKKIAVYGMSPVVKVIVAFVVGLFRGGEICFYSTREEALEWLKEDY